MRVLIGCESSGTVRNEFRRLGHDAFSCDLLPADDGSEYHIQGNVLDVLSSGTRPQWDLFIGHPPCTFLTNAANGHPEIVKSPERMKLRELAIEFFFELWNSPIPMVCLENPVGAINSIFKPHQTIHPFFFGDPAKKRTCLWLRGLPKLKCVNTRIDPPPPVSSYVNKHGVKKYLNFVETCKSSKENPRWKVRSKTFPGIARAMAEQWGSDQLYEQPVIF